MQDYSGKNAEVVLEKLEKLITAGDSRRIKSVYNDLSIFDWWTDELSVSQMKQMRTFLKTAIKEGYKGYVCFKVGARGCSNGMWAHTCSSTDGYSPNNGKVLYRSFSPEYTYWRVDNGKEFLPKDEEYNCCKTYEQLKKYLEKNI